MPSHFYNDITDRVKLQKELKAAEESGKTLKQWREDRQYLQVISDITAENEANEAEDLAAMGNREEQPESAAARNARLKGESEAMRLSPELVATQKQKNLEEEEAVVSESNRMMDREYDKTLAKGGEALGVSSADYVGEYMGGGRVGPDGKRVGPGHVMYKPFKGSSISEEYLAEPPAEDVAGESQMVRAEEGFMPPSEAPEEGDFKIGEISGKKYYKNKDGIYVGKDGKAPKELGWQIPEKPPLDDDYDVVAKEEEALEYESALPESPEELIVAGEQSDAQQDQNAQEVIEMKKVQKDPKARKELFKDLSKEETAMAKEEFGNYYIGPGGYAINLDKVESSLKREGDFRLLQFIPNHAKPHMLAKMGYLDPEDVEGMPESPEYNTEELKGLQAIALQKVKNESNEKIVDKNIIGRDALATKLYTSQAEINAANNTLTETLENRRIDVKELELDASLFMHGDKLDMQQYLKDKDIELTREELQQLDTHFTKKLSFEYSQMFTNDDYKNRVVDQSDAQFNRKFDRLDKQDQEAMIMAEFNRAQKTVEMYIDAGQFNSAVLASAGMPSRLVGFNYKTYYKNKAKTSGTDPIFTAAMGMSDNLVGYMASSGKDVKKLRDEYYNRQDALTTQLMKEGDIGMGEPSFMDQKMLELEMVQFDSLPAISVKTSEGKIITAGKDEYNNNRMQYRSAMRIKIFDQIMKKDPVYGQLYNNINNAQTHYQTKGSLDTFGGGGGSKNKPPVVVKEPEIKTKTETTVIPKKEPESGPLPDEPDLVVAPGKKNKAPYKRLDKAYKNSEREHRQAIRKPSVIANMKKMGNYGVYEKMIKKKKDKMEKDKAALKKYIEETQKRAARSSLGSQPSY